MRFIFKCAAFIVAGIAIAAGTFTAQQAIAADSNVSVAAIPGSFSPSTDVDLGHLSSPNMAVEVVLAPSNAAQLSTLLTSLYDSTNSNYQKWLAPGEFNAKFAPSEASVAAVTSHLQANGLTVQSTGSPFLLRARGPSSNVEAAFGTTLHNYINSRGITYFSNTSAVLVPSSVAAAVFGVVGLSSTVRLHTNTLPNKHRSGGSPTPSCETPYVTQTELFDYFNYGTGFSYGYGGGPACSGLTPSQTNAFYGAAEVGPSGKGAGVNFAVFELSAYLHSDIDTWARLFYGDSYTPPLKDINVDGGPLYPVCPGGDTCPPQYNGYSGDIEVDADIEMTLSIAPAARNILVYLAPNDYTGQTELDMYAKIANDDVADVISSSWGTCENDAGPAYAQAENLLFQQIASQGQSMFSSSGDTGAFGCIRTDGTTIVNAADPATQPWVTSVGGTSFESANPGSNPDPQYPSGVETVWNVLNLCNESYNEGGVPDGESGYPLSGYFWCAETGAGGGGNSQFWGRPIYQFGPGITNPYTTYGNGTTQCALARAGSPCREVPDVSANADPYTGYAEYCTGNPNPPDYSTCGTFSSGEPAPGWFGIGGTSLSSPLWSAVIGDRVAFMHHHRIGNANQLLYGLYNSDYYGYFHDITGFWQSTNNNGLFPTTPGFDLATGIGTPKIGAIVTGFPEY